MYTRPNMQYIIILHQHTLLSEPISTHSINACTPSLTCDPIDHGWPLILLLFLRSCAVLFIHFADRRGAFALDFCVKLLVKQNLVHQVRLHWAGLCRRLWSAIVITFEKNKDTVKRKNNLLQNHSLQIFGENAFEVNKNILHLRRFKGVKLCNFLFSFSLVCYVAVCAYTRSAELQSSKSPTKGFILSKRQGWSRPV